jgi:anaerobic carbon-monoxide dehydrogenase iron sulfur subunit
METRRLRVQPGRCSGCRLCLQICAISHQHETNPRKAALRIEARFPQPGVYQPRVCTQCGMCLAACPEGAIYRREDGAYVVVVEKCNDCGECLKVCKPGVMVQHPDLGHVVICDNCFKCVDLCNTGALEIVSRPAREKK